MSAVLQFHPCNAIRSTRAADNIAIAREQVRVALRGKVSGPVLASAYEVAASHVRAGKPVNFAVALAVNSAPLKRSRGEPLLAG